MLDCGIESSQVMKKQERSFLHECRPGLFSDRRARMRQDPFFAFSELSPLWPAT
jgi:hypothetical protein